MSKNKYRKGEVIQIRLNLEGELADKFLKIKKRYGLESNTDLIRLLIVQAYDQLKKEGYFE
jgi:hypothetical protein